MVTGADLREAMRAFPSGVAVLATGTDDDALAITVGSLVSLSLEPPLVGVTVGHGSTMHEPLRRSEGFSISIVAADQAQLAQHFARSGLPPIARWVDVEWREARYGRLLAGAAAWLECRHSAQHEVGDHTLFVGGVVSVERGTGIGGLVYRDGAYCPTA